MAARGEFILFFNDDAVADPNMVSSLVDSMSYPVDPSRPVGAATAVFYNTDGTVQEAGSRILSTAGTVQLGSGLSAADAADAGYLDRRAIDYGSGAALLIRKSLLLALGGHDARYRPAYYEDVDLAFRVRASGADIVLEPKARAVHRSGASTDDDRRFREFAGKHSGDAFLARWAHVIDRAARTEDGLDALCPAPSPAPSQPLTSITERSSDVALGIAADYEEWMNGKLDECRDSHQLLQEQLAQARAESHRLGALAEERGQLAHEFHLRLRAIEDLRPARLLKWRFDLAQSRRATKRSG